MAEAWKFLNERNGLIKSAHGDQTWVPGEWVDHSGSLELCMAGFHASPQIQQAFSFVQGELLARVETRGESVEALEGDKSVYSSMRLTKVYRWTKRDSVELAIFAAEQVLSIFESRRPNDDRPRKAIEAARAYLAAESEAAAEAAAWAARAAWAAAGAAEAAAWAAAEAAWAAAWAAAGAAWAAAEAAAWAAWAAEAAARQELLDKIEEWLVARVETLAEWTSGDGS